MRHPDLHQNPEVIVMPGKYRTARTCIELAQHDDGRWMWAWTFLGDKGGQSFSCGAKWGKFAASRRKALVCAINEIRARQCSDRTCSWLNTLEHGSQLDMFGGC